jgi:hypothetical protein
MFYDEDYGWDVTDSIDIEAFMEKSKKVGLNESEFDWTEVSDPISVGMVFKVLGNEYPNQTLAKMVVTHVSNDEVRFINQTNGLNPNGQEFTITKQKALELIDDKYWVPVGENKYHYDKWRKDNGLTESEFDWVQDVPDYDAYRFFDVYVCGDNQYDEETGEDECLDGGSYFIRIPKEEVEEIWYLDVDDMGGPGDEGSGVIQWAQYNAKIDPDEYAMVEYVREIDRTMFCQAVGWSNQDICGNFINESNDFDWTNDIDSGLNKNTIRW